MRELSMSELELVSGGYNTYDLGWTDPVTPPGGGGGDWGWGDWGDWGDYGDGGGDGGGGGGGGVDAGPPPKEIPDCVTAKPTIGDEDMFMKVVEHLTNELRGMFNGVQGNTPIDSSRYEYGVAIYEHNGQIGYGNINTNNSPDFVNITIGSVPDGARIIAFMHNHPDQPGIDDRVPSNHKGGDWDQRDSLVNNENLPRGITVDQNLLLVLYTNQDDKTRIYDKTDKNKETPSCPI